jgi:ABC-2 type transport system ATP-binding protein
MSELVIEAAGLTKRYGPVAAVSGLDLEVRGGEVLGLLGPNGAGKTTTILMLLGLTEASAGTVRILGRDPLREPLAVKRDVGYLPDSVGFYDTMTGRENLAFTARLAGLSRETARARIAIALAKVRLSEVADRRVGTYSHGMRQRLGIAELLMRECRVAILDEPTSGLDPQSTDELLELIRQLSAEGITVLLSSHMLDVVQTICDRVALFNRGKIGFIGTVEELAARIGGGAYIVEVEADGIGADDLAAVPGVKAVSRAGALWEVEAERDVRPELARQVVARDGTLRRLELKRSRLGEAYNRYFREVANAA